MTRVCVTAPGKAVIAGEYAVLFGAPALVAAINRRATVRIAASPDRYHRVSVPGLADGRWRFHAEPGGRIDWRDEVVGGSLDLFACAWRHCEAGLAAPVSIEIDTQAFFDPRTGSKFGLGSSAAVAAALAASLRSPGDDTSAVWPLARKIHRDFQAGSGSGVDIAASVFGGILVYRAADREPPRTLAWPRGLHSRFLWTGKAADTREKLRKLGEGSNGKVAALANTAEKAATAWVTGDAGGILAALDGYVDELARFSDALDLGVFEAGHGELLALAKAGDVVYKPCGAGGGDIGVVMSESVEAVETFCTSAAKLGFAIPGLEVDPHGLTIVEKDRS